MRTIYVNPGETLNIRVVFNDLDPKTAGTWNQQLHSQRAETRITIKQPGHISFSDPLMRVDQTDVTGKAVRFR